MTITNLNATCGSLFENKLIEKLNEKPSSKWLPWVKSFAEKLACCHYPDVMEAGMALANALLDLPNDSPLALAISVHLEKLLETGTFLDKCVNLDEYAINQAKSALLNFEIAILSLKPSKLVDTDKVPENVTVNPKYISDPRIMLYNILSQSGSCQLSEEDDTIEMELAFILADLREKFLQRVIPEDHKDRNAQVAYVKNKLQGRFMLVEERNEVDESIVNLCYKRMSVTALMGYIVEGGSSNIYIYTDTSDEKKKYTIPIAKRQGYAGPQAMIDHVYQSMNEKGAFKMSLLKEQKNYFPENSETITKSGVKALLYSTGYLV